MPHAMSATLLFTLPVLLAAMAWASPLDTIRLIKLSPQDARAVVKGADGKLQVVKPGDRLGERVTVKEIAVDRVVLEEQTDTGLETVIVTTENGANRIERLQRRPDKRPLLSAPTVLAPGIQVPQ